MRLGRLLASLSLSAALVGCVNLDLTDPNEPSTDTFWQTAADAVAGVNAVYNGLQNNGTYGRWLVFASDHTCRCSAGHCRRRLHLPRRPPRSARTCRCSARWGRSDPD